jgi:transglutaminase-like putative cysteine protease
MDQSAFTGREITPGARVVPAPAWVDLAPYPIPPSANPHFIAHGLCVLLDDSQVSLCEGDRAWFYRRAEMVTASAGTEHASQFSVSFDPAFERVEIHGATVIRNGQRIEHAPEGAFEVLRRERNLERLHFDGRLTLSLTLPDVRQGDVVETSYTIYGARRSLGGRHSLFVGLEWPVGIVDVRFRQRWPKERVLQERTFNDVPQGVQTEADGVIDKRWRLQERPGRKFEQLTPPWILQNAALQISEWRDWAEVVEVFAPLYADTGSFPAELEQEVARIGTAEPTPEGRAAAILRYTQSAVRYLAISMGEGGYTPRTLAETCETRYGDCKDKSKLYTEMARRLGLDACPALVNTRDSYAIEGWLPSATHFDHCIVRLAIGEKIYWLDPTRQLQASPLDKISQSYLGWALPLRAGVTAVERMPEPPVEVISETLESILLGEGPSTPVRYEWEHKFKNSRAEAIREQFAREGAVGVFKAYADDIQRTWPGARVLTQELVSDDVERNVIIVREAYEIADAWAKGEDGRYSFATRDIAIRGSLAPLDPGPRVHPIYLGQPGLRTRRVDVRTETNHDGGWMRGQAKGALSWSDQLRTVSTQYLVLEQSLEIKGFTLDAADAEVYRKVEKDISTNDLVLAETVQDGLFTGRGELPKENTAWETVRWILMALVAIWIVARWLGGA